MHRPRPCPRWDCINARQRKSDKAAPARARHVPSLVPVSAQNAAKPRGSPPTALEFTAETDSALEGTGFEPSVLLGGPMLPGRLMLRVSASERSVRTPFGPNRLMSRIRTPFLV